MESGYGGRHDDPQARPHPDAAEGGNEVKIYEVQAIRADGGAVKVLYSSNDNSELIFATIPLARELAKQIKRKKPRGLQVFFLNFNVQYSLFLS